MSYISLSQRKSKKCAAKLNRLNSSVTLAYKRDWEITSIRNMKRKPVPKVIFSPRC